MNNFYSPPELIYRPRWLTPLLRQATQDHPVVVLSGARQVGKSTLLRQADPFGQWPYRTLDDFQVMEQARREPHSLWAGVNALIIDEVQKAPQLLPAVKQAIDSRPGHYRFILSGSANLLLMSQVSESLAGRAIYLLLDPITLGEMGQEAPPTLLQQALSGRELTLPSLPPPPDPARCVLRGFLPALLALSRPESWLRWWEGYIATYLERDLRQISQIDSLLDYRRVMELLALRTGQLLNQSEIGRDGAISQPTVHRYLNLLEASHLFQRLLPFTANHTGRLLKSPRIFWADAGLAAFLAGYYDEASLRQSREFGFFFETLIYHHLRVLVNLLTPRAKIYSWRTQNGDEVDFVIEYGRKLVAIEVKLTDNPGYRHTSGLRQFIQAHPDCVWGFLLHGGPQISQLGEKIIALPWSHLTGMADEPNGSVPQSSA